MRPSGTDRVAWSVDLSVCRSVTVLSRAKTAEPIEKSFGLRIQVSLRKYILGRGTHWRHLANTIGLSMCDGDVACYQITLTICYAVSGRVV